MNLNFNQIGKILYSCKELQEIKMPFKLSLILAKNISILQNEYDFYIEREREFALKYLEIDEETKQFKQISEGIFKIKDGLEQECQEARQELNEFTVDINLRMIHISLIENMDLTPAQVSGLELIIKEEE